jgi:hypothetical protein
MTSRPYRVAYVAGTGRSGSTLVAQYLERHSGGVHVGELRYLWERGVSENHLCECGSPFDRCEFWTEVMALAYGDDLARLSDELKQLSPRVDRIRRIPQAMTGAGRAYGEHRRRYGELVTPLYDAIAKIAGTDLVIDSSKDPSYLFLLSALDDIDVLPLHLVRDPRAVAYSWTRTRRRPEIHWKEQYMRTLRPRRAALIWLEYNTAFELFMARRGSSARLRYEDFSEDPEATIDRLARTAGTTATAAADGNSRGHSFSGNPMRFDRGPRVVTPDNEWEVGLPLRAQRVVTGLTLPLLPRYGYRTTVRKTSNCA